MTALSLDYRPAKNDRHHPAKYLHQESCLGKDTNGAVCDCERIPNPRWSPGSDTTRKGDTTMTKTEKIARLTQAVCQANMTFNHLTGLTDEDRSFIDTFRTMCAEAEVSYLQPPQQVHV